MSDRVKPHRPYDASGRREEASRRRGAVLESARDLMESLGYTAMTMPRVAERAGVSTEFVYKAFGDKARLVREVLDVALAGDHDPVPMAQRPEIRQLVAEPDAGVVLDLYAALIARVNARAGRLSLALAAAASGDARLADVWEGALGQRLAGARAVARDVAGKSTLAVAEPEAADIIWTLNSPELYALIVVARGWSPERYARWVAQMLRASLLPTT